IVVDASTCQCHCKSKHTGKYQNWCKKVRFESKLAGDSKAEQLQCTIDTHLVEKKLANQVTYSDNLFWQVAIEWLVVMDQPIQALDHPKFKEMVNITSHATNGVKIPSCKAT
ncbi:hypothetical protein EDB86DRAFT_2804095, partial [Lactarius hatsudake]